MAYLDLILQRKICSRAIIRETTKREIEGLSPIIDKQNYCLLLIKNRGETIFQNKKISFSSTSFLPICSFLSTSLTL
jgi:hypothetical protein